MKKKHISKVKKPARALNRVARLTRYNKAPSKEGPLCVGQLFVQPQVVRRV